MKRTNGLKTRLIAMALLLAATVGAPALAQTAMEPENTILVHGTSEITAQPDSVAVTVAVETQGGTVEQARTLNSQKMNQVMAAIRRLNLSNMRMQTQGFNAYPVYSDQQNTGEPSKIVAYRVSNSLSVMVEGVPPGQVADAASHIVDTASQNGATSVNGFRFYLNNMDKVQTQAINAAMTNARQQADALAHAAGVTLKGVYSIESSPQSQVRPIPMMAMREAQSTPVEPGQVTVNSEVTVRYRY